MAPAARAARTATKKICFLCGRDGADSTEHVVSRCLWPDRRLPNGVPTLPAHRRCNRHTSKDEEAFRNFIAAAIPPSSPGRPLWDRTWSAIHKPEAKGMLRSYYGDIIQASRAVHGHLNGPLVATIEPERAQRVLAKIVRGLFCLETGEQLLTDAWWSFDQMQAGSDRSVVLPHQIRVGDVLTARWGRASDAPDVTFWTLTFYETLAWYGTTKATSALDAGPFRPAVQILWPGP